MRKVDAELSEGYHIRFARYEDIDEIMNFFKKHWKETHILANDRAFFEYEFCRGREVCFVLLMNAKDQIEGTLGYIPYDTEDRDIFIVMWKVLPNHQIFAGVGLLNFLMENGKCRHIYTSGLNESTRNIYRYMGFQTGKLVHYYMLNPQCENRIAIIRDRSELNAGMIDENYDIQLKQLVDEAEFSRCYVPETREDRIKKSVEYMLHRYFHHPKYNYNIYQVVETGKTLPSFLITREQTENSATVLRVIDFVGDERKLQYIGRPIRKILEENHYEYADMYVFGVDPQLLIRSGFTQKQENSANVIPDYFYPFEQKNVDINIFWEKETHPLIFKGDGDQDRPSA